MTILNFFSKRAASASICCCSFSNACNSLMTYDEDDEEGDVSEGDAVVMPDKECVVAEDDTANLGEVLRIT